jgi:hypothetical protein
VTLSQFDLIPSAFEKILKALGSDCPHPNLPPQATEGANAKMSDA